MNFDTLVKNVTDAATKKSAWKDWSLAIAGGLSYPIIPTAIESFLGIDMTGRKGAITGLLSTFVIGAATKSYAYVAGGIGAFAGHVAYVDLNDVVIAPVFGKYLFRYDPATPQTFADELQPGAQATALPDGTNSAYYAAANRQLPPAQNANPAMSDNYVNQLQDNYASQLEDNYSSQLMDGAAAQQATPEPVSIGSQSWQMN